MHRRSRRPHRAAAAALKLWPHGVRERVRKHRLPQPLSNRLLILQQPQPGRHGGRRRGVRSWRLHGRDLQPVGRPPRVAQPGRGGGEAALRGTAPRGVKVSAHMSSPRGRLPFWKRNPSSKPLPASAAGCFFSACFLMAANLRVRREGARFARARTPPVALVASCKLWRCDAAPPVAAQQAAQASAPLLQRQRHVRVGCQRHVAERKPPDERRQWV